MKQSISLSVIFLDDTLNSTDNVSSGPKVRMDRLPNYSISEYESDRSHIKELSKSNASMSKLQVALSAMGFPKRS